MHTNYSFLHILCKLKHAVLLVNRKNTHLPINKMKKINVVGFMLYSLIKCHKIISRRRDNYFGDKL